MKNRFVNLWNRIGAVGSAETEFNRLSNMYSGTERFYHDMKHMQNCLNEFDSANELVIHPDAVEFAIWYHDAIYDSRAHDNEERSAQLAYDVCLSSCITDPFAKEVKDLIIATKHNEVPNGIDAKILMDADLSILGKPSVEFNEYEKNIRKEYSWVGEDDFRKGRSAVLEGFLERDSIYSTDFFRYRLEAQARSNLERVLQFSPVYTCK